jgi:hypothetical protein
MLQSRYLWYEIPAAPTISDRLHNRLTRALAWPPLVGRSAHGCPQVAAGRTFASPAGLGLRIFSAIRWFNGSSRETIDHHEAILNLSTAFEALLALPQSEKTDRLVDSISLLLGRVPRLDSWAQQFYDTRSKIVHEGTAQQLHFIIKDRNSSQTGVEILQPL